MTGEDRTTPRPWRRTRECVVHGTDRFGVCPGCNGTLDRLRAIEEAARSALALVGGEAPLLEHYRREIERVLRAALEGATHD